MPRNLEGEQFLHQRDDELHLSPEVEHEQARREAHGEKTSQKPADKIADWLKIIERTHGHRDNPAAMERIKEYYHREYVIKPEDIPESYFDNQKRLAKERGHGDVEITPEMRQESAEIIIADQESTLDKWLDYFTCEDADVYPMWAKYWAFTGMVGLSTYDKEKHAFGKRGEGTVAPFPDLNREALAYAIDNLVKRQGPEYKSFDQKIREGKNKLKKLEGERRKAEKTGGVFDAQQIEELQKSISDLESAQQRLVFGNLDVAEDDKAGGLSNDFGTLYAFAIEKVTPTEENELKNTKGEWVKYDQGSDHMPLVESLQGHGTGWCTAGESTAEAQLNAGDFYVYYSYDKAGKPTIPRVAIRMEGDSIGEVRGIADNQNIDSAIAGTDIIKEKLEKFPDGKEYQKKEENMRRLTEIAKKFHSVAEIEKQMTDIEYVPPKSDIEERYKELRRQLKEVEQKNKEVELSKEELRFLYEMDAPIQGFGYEKDPRIGEMKNQRDLEADLSIIFNCRLDQVALSRESLNNETVAIIGWLDYSFMDKLPETLIYVAGDMDISESNIKRLPGNLQYVGGDLRIRSEQILDFPKNLKNITGDLLISGITTKGLPEDIKSIVKGGIAKTEYRRKTEWIKRRADDDGYDEFNF